MMRQGDKAKLAPEQEQALLEKLRRQREEKAHNLLQLEAQTLSAKMAHMDLSTLPEVAKQTSTSNSTMATDRLAGNIALVLNVLMRSCSPPDVKESPSKGKGSGKKGANSVKAAAAKVVEGAPPEAALVKKVLKANTAMLKSATNGTAAGQLALLKALQAWLMSPQGVNACGSAAKLIEVFYDADLAEDEVFTKFWEELNAQLVREEAELVEAKAALETLTSEKATAEEEMRKAEAEQTDAAYHEKQAEVWAQNTRCGGNPTKEDEIAEKEALANLKKCRDYKTQTNKITAARSKKVTEVRGEFETSQRLVEQLNTKAERGGALFAKHAKPFFEWLAADDDDDDDDDEAVEVK